MTTNWKHRVWLVASFAVLLPYLLLAPTNSEGQALQTGDIVVSDSRAIALFRVDPLTGGKTVLSSGGPAPEGITIDADGIVIAASNSGPVFLVDPVSGAQTVIAEGGCLVNPRGVALDAAGNIIVVDTSAGGTPGLGGIIRVNPVTGAQTILSLGGNLVGLTGGAVDAVGNIIVAAQSLGAVIRVDPVFGTQTVVSSGGSLSAPTSIAFDAAGDIIVGDQNATGQSFGAVLRVDPVTGANTIISSGGIFEAATGVAIEASGNILVGNQNADYIVRVDPANGAQTVFSAGGGFQRPTWIAVFRQGLPKLNTQPEGVPGSCTRQVAIDIKPGTFPNIIELNKKKGVIPVAILTAGLFDATTVDASTVRFGATGSEAAPVQSALADVDGDGDLDLILHFKTQNTGIVCGDTSATLTGVTMSGHAIQVSDSIQTVHCK